MENNMNNIPQKPTEQNGIGPVVGSMIVIVVVIVGGFYFWGSKIAKDRQSMDVQNQAMSASHDMDSGVNSVDVNQLSIPEQDANEIGKQIQDL